MEAAPSKTRTEVSQNQDVKLQKCRMFYLYLMQSIKFSENF